MTDELFNKLKAVYFKNCGEDEQDYFLDIITLAEEYTSSKSEIISLKNLFMTIDRALFSYIIQWGMSDSEVREKLVQHFVTRIKNRTNIDILHNNIVDKLIEHEEGLYQFVEQGYTLNYEWSNCLDVSLFKKYSLGFVGREDERGLRIRSFKSEDSVNLNYFMYRSEVDGMYPTENQIKISTENDLYKINDLLNKVKEFIK